MMVRHFALAIGLGTMCLGSLGSLGSMGCGGEPGAGETGSSMFEDEVQPILDGCICHQQNTEGLMTADFMTLNAGMSRDQIVGVPSEQLPTMNRITPGSLEDSYLWHKIKGTHLDVGGDGDRMPALGAISDDKIATIEDWILAGAPS